MTQTHPGNSQPVDLANTSVTGSFRCAFNRIFGAIEEYHRQLGYPKREEKANAPSSDAMRQANEVSLAIFKEASELVDSYPWKPWKKYPEDLRPDLINCAEEGIDIIFFIGALFEIFNISPDTAADVLERKLMENKRRIFMGYNKSAEEMNQATQSNL